MLRVIVTLLKLNDDDYKLCNSQLMSVLQILQISHFSSWYGIHDSVQMLLRSNDRFVSPLCEALCRTIITIDLKYINDMMYNLCTTWCSSCLFVCIFCVFVIFCFFKCIYVSIDLCVSITISISNNNNNNICAPHLCCCGAQVDACGTNSLVCKQAPGRGTRHHVLNDMVARAFASAGFQFRRSQQASAV